MRKFSVAVAGLLTVLCGIGPNLASPAGLWELDTRDTRFRIEMCGDGTQLCGTLAWLSDADYNDQYIPYLNTAVANGIRQAGPNRWKGSMSLFGQGIAGTITQQSEDHMSLTGCAFVVVCKTYQMTRIAE